MHLFRSCFTALNNILHIPLLGLMNSSVKFFSKEIYSVCCYCDRVCFLTSKFSQFLLSCYLTTVSNMYQAYSKQFTYINSFHSQQTTGWKLKHNLHRRKPKQRETNLSTQVTWPGKGGWPLSWWVADLGSNTDHLDPESLLLTIKLHYLWCLHICLVFIQVPICIKFFFLISRDTWFWFIYHQSYI